MSYCTTENIVNRIGETALIQLTDDAGIGVVNDDLVAAAITQAEATIDSYCQGRYTVPFTTVPAKLTELCVDIAVYNLYSRSDLTMPQVRTDRYNAAIRFLEKVAGGTIQLGVVDPAPVNTDSLEKTSGAKEERIFTRDKMKGY